ncbi:ribosomal L37ae protein family-domain-containing protein [Infundibulicybe gibba]|nr:ribosomal L37ae protein family-domain-containing protein [Infundibulicybe gibba]
MENTPEQPIQQAEVPPTTGATESMAIAPVTFPAKPTVASRGSTPVPTPPRPRSPATSVPPSVSSREEEPQNTLTRKFTEKEWAALKEFRTKLPDILAEAYPDDPKARETPITFWGIQLNPANPVDARVSVVLMKFLRARNLSVRDAQDMLVATLRWRVEFDVEAAMKEEFPQEVFGQLGRAYGHDPDGRPVVYNIYGGNKDLKAVFGDVQRFVRWRVALMEQSVNLLDFNEVDQMIQIHGTSQSALTRFILNIYIDYEGVSLTSRDANSKNAASEATNIFQNHYPELLYKKLFIHVPTLLNWIFWAFKPLISANTLAKMTVVGTGRAAVERALEDHPNLASHAGAQHPYSQVPSAQDTVPSAAPTHNFNMTKRTKKVGITGKYGTRYGASLRKQVKKMEISQHARYTCTFCGKDSVKRTAVGIWNCSACKKVIAGGAWSVQTTAAATVRSTVRRLRELTEA